MNFQNGMTMTTVSETPPIWRIRVLRVRYRVCVSVESHSSLGLFSNRGCDVYILSQRMHAHVVIPVVRNGTRFRVESTATPTKRGSFRVRGQEQAVPCRAVPWRATSLAANSAHWFHRARRAQKTKEADVLRSMQHNSIQIPNKHARLLSVRSAGGAVRKGPTLRVEDFARGGHAPRGGGSQRGARRQPPPRPLASPPPRLRLPLRLQPTPEPPRAGGRLA